MDLADPMEHSLMQVNSLASSNISTFTTILLLIQQFHLWYVF